MKTQNNKMKTQNNKILLGNRYFSFTSKIGFRDFSLELIEILVRILKNKCLSLVHHVIEYVLCILNSLHHFLVLTHHS